MEVHPVDAGYQGADSEDRGPRGQLLVDLVERDRLFVTDEIEYGIGELFRVPDLIRHAKQVVVDVAEEPSRLGREGLLVDRIQHAVQQPASRIDVATEARQSLLDRVELLLNGDVWRFEHELLELFDF